MCGAGVMKPKTVLKEYAIELTPAQQQLIVLRRKLSHSETRFLDKQKLWEQIIALEETMDDRDIKLVSRLVATEP
jgi:hypothetical protein